MVKENNPIFNIEMLPTDGNCCLSVGIPQPKSHCGDDFLVEEQHTREVVSGKETSKFILLL